MKLQAFISRRVVAPEGIRPAAILVEGEIIRELVPPEQVPGGSEIHDFGNAAILPGRVDSHDAINEPGEPSGRLSTATRAAAAGGYTFVVDMPLNCLPATITAAALEAKREAARVPGGLGGGRRGQRQSGTSRLPAAGVPGFGAFD